MVKIPGLDDLKKMGTGLIDSAKSVKLGEMVDKLKTGIESVGSKAGANIPQGDAAMKEIFQGLNASVNELLQMHTAQVTAVKKLQSQLADLARVIDATAKVTTTQSEDPKQ